MARPSCARLILKWVSAAFCGLFLMLFATGWSPPGVWYTFSDGTVLGTQVHMGHLDFMLDDYVPSTSATSRPVVVSGFQVGDFGQKFPETYAFYFTLDVNTRIAHMDHQHLLPLPLWLLVLLTAIPTAWLMVRDRRRIRPGHCLRCGYDLTGNLSGVCSECGAKTPTGKPPPASV